MHNIPYSIGKIPYLKGKIRKLMYEISDFRNFWKEWLGEDSPVNNCYQ
jgi:hypothetical protein